MPIERFSSWDNQWDGEDKDPDSEVGEGEGDHLDDLLNSVGLEWDLGGVEEGEEADDVRYERDRGDNPGGKPV